MFFRVEVSGWLLQNRLIIILWSKRKSTNLHYQKFKSSFSAISTVHRTLTRRFSVAGHFPERNWTYLDCLTMCLIAFKIILLQTETCLVHKRSLELFMLDGAFVVWWIQHSARRRVQFNRHLELKAGNFTEPSKCFQTFEWFSKFIITVKSENKVLFFLQFSQKFSQMSSSPWF